MLRLTTFESDITPPIGHPLCAGWYPPASAVETPLSALGLVFVPDDDLPMVLCALDWAELSNGDYDRWRMELANAVKTVPERVAVHCIHAHDTPWPDRDAQDILDQYGCHDVIMAGDWAEQSREKATLAAKRSLECLRPCSQIGIGQARVDQIASNRRIMGPDGKVKAVRWTKSPDPTIRAEPEGLIDPMLKTVSFWHDNAPLAMLHYYAVHPTSKDGTGIVTPEFFGLARNRCATEQGIPHLYFTGGAGNITAGKYNDGMADNRSLFTNRIHDAMSRSIGDTSRSPIVSLKWITEEVCLPPRQDLEESALLSEIQAAAGSSKVHSKAALMLTYRRRKDRPIPFTCLHINDDTLIVHLPGETFIEYQLHAQDARPDAFVSVAGYGDLGTGYITLTRSFAEGGYEPVDAFVSGESEHIMKRVIDRIVAKADPA